MTLLQVYQNSTRANCTTETSQLSQDSVATLSNKFLETG